MSTDFQEIKRAGEQMLSTLNKEFRVELGFNKQTVQWLDTYITLNRDHFLREEIYNITVPIGYILGESIIAEYGGKWVFNKDFDQWVVDIGPGICNPIGKTQKYLISTLIALNRFLKLLE